MSYNIQNIASIEAAEYLNISLTEFINYTNRGLICYKLIEKRGLERFYSRKDLDSFKKEVLTVTTKL